MNVEWKFNRANIRVNKILYGTMYITVVVAPALATTHTEDNARQCSEENVEISKYNLLWLVKSTVTYL